MSNLNQKISKAEILGILKRLGERYRNEQLPVKCCGIFLYTVYKYINVIGLINKLTGQ